jgi:glycerophosphoryl diester phosphodiesterase
MRTSRPTLIGHRGLGRGVVDGHEQNTLGSFLAALRAGVDWVEVDVRRTGDDALVVAHDATYADGTFLVDLSAAQVRRRGTLPLPDLLDALPADAGISLDLKSCMEDAARRPDLTTAALLAPLAQREARRRPLWVTSFDPGALALVRAAAPQLERGLLTWYAYPTEHAVAAAAHLDVQVLGLQVGSLWPEVAPQPMPRPRVRPLSHVLAALHSAGRQLAVWCPGLVHARELAQAGVDALYVDDVPTTVRALSAGRVPATGSLPVPSARSAAPAPGPAPTRPRPPP